MNLLQAIVLGIVQGLTEFLPISSSGHLRIVPALFGWDDPGTAFTAVLQLGTIAAVLVYFASDIRRIFMAWIRGLRDAGARNADYKLGWMIVLGTLPISVLGLLLRHWVSDQGRNLTLIGTTLIVFGVVLAIAERFGKQRREIEALSVRDGVAIGFAQAAALVPGVSRSGATISAGLALGMTREAAARFSFLLSIPAIVLSGLFELKDLGDNSSASATATIVAVIVSFVVGYLSIAFLLRFLAHHSTYVFSIYRVALGSLVLILVAAGSIN